MAGRRLLQSIFLIALIGLLFFATNAEARRRAPKPPKPRIIPILECVVIGKKTYTAYFGYENEDGVPVNVTIDTDDNRITGFAWGIGWSNRVPWHFNIWRIVPGRPGRSPLYPNAVFSLELPLFSIGIWTLCGRIVLITQWGPKCQAPDQTGPVFTTPSRCPATYTIPTEPGTVDGSFTQCFQAVDTDTEGGITWENTFDRDEDTRCLEDVPILGLGAHAGSVTARDRCGNPTKCDITVVVVDREAPVVTCPASRSVPITNIYDEKLTIGNEPYVQATARDNNPASSLTYKWYGRTLSWTGPQCLSGTGQFAAGQYAFGKTYLSWTVTDNAGNQGSCSSTVITVTDGAKPYFKTCPGPVQFNQGDAVPRIYAKAVDTLTKVTVSVTRISPTGVSTPGRTLSAGCKNDVTVDGSQNSNGQVVAFEVGQSTLIFTATDDNGNTQTCTTTVTVISQTPAFTFCPASQTVGTVKDKPYGNITAPAAVAPAGFVITNTIVGPSGSTTGSGGQVSGQYPVGVTSVSFSASKNGAVITCKTITFTVNDTQAPTLTCPSTPYNLNTDSGLAYATVPAGLSATGEDNNKVTVSFTSSDISGGTDVFASATATQKASATSTLPVSQLNVGTYGVTWSATDGVASATPCTISIVVTDNEKPVIQCPASATYTLAGGAESVSVDASTTTVTATDNVGVVSIKRNDGVVTNSVVASLFGPTLASGASSKQYDYTFTAFDAQGNSAACSFSITVNVQTYCTASTCANGGTCTTTTGNGGVAVGYMCDCSNTYCYSSFPNCKSTDTASYPFPTAPATTTQTVAGCDSVTVTADSTTCMYAAVAAGAQDLVRSWTLVSTTPTPTITHENAVKAILAAAGTSVTFDGDDLIGGYSYTIRLQYEHTPTGSKYMVDTVLAKQSGNSPTVAISGPPYPWQLTQGDTTTQFTLVGSATTCSAMTPNPQYSWTSSVSLNCGLVTNLATLTVPFSCSGLLMNTDIVFTLTVTDGNGVTGSNTITVKIVPYEPPSSECGQPNQAPKLEVLVNPQEGSIQTVDFIQNGVSCPTGDAGGCAVDFEASFQNQFDASGCSDPRACPTGPQYLLGYHWEIFYPPLYNNGAKYTSNGISGYFDKVLVIRPGSLPDLSQVSPTDQYWRMKLTLQSTVPTNPLTTVGVFRMLYKNSDLTIDVANQCNVPIPVDPSSCPFEALAVDPTVSTANGFAVQDDTPITYEWTSNPPLDLTNSGWNTARLTPPTLAAGTYYVFTVTATKGSRTGRKSITIYTVSNTPTGGTFSVSPTTGMALSTSFLLSSTGWTSSQALTYTWKYITGEDVVGATENSLTTLGWAPSTRVYLPAGRITLVAYIYAQEGSYVRKSVTIDVTEQTTTNRACWLLDMMNTLLAQAEQQQDMSKTLQLVSYLADYLKDSSLQGVTSLTCNGVDRTADIQAVRSRFMTLLEKLSNQPLDATQASMLTVAMNKVISNARITAITQNEAVSAATMLSTVINGMSTTSGETQGAMANMQEQILSLVSQLAGWIQDCSVLSTLADDMRTMFVAANAKGLPGSTNVYMSGENVIYGSSTVWANVAQSASLDDVVFNFPAGSLTSTSNFNINFINYLNDHVRECRARDVSGNAAVVASTVVSVEVVNAATKSVLSVSGLATPITFTLPLRTVDVEDVPSCGTNAGALTCAWWDADAQGWSTAGCQTMSTSATTTSGAPGVQCACSHLTEFAVIRPSTICPDKSMLRGFRGTVAVYVVLFAIVFGLFCRTVRQTHFELRENMLFTFLASVACALRIAIGSHYAEFITFPTGVVDVLAVVPYAILYWINGHYFAIVRIQRIESTEARVRWRVEPIIRFVLFCVFLGMLTLLAGTGMDSSSQSKMAIVVSRIVALAYTVANIIFFGYGCTLLLGYATGRSDVGLTRALAVMSFATLMESIFWAVYPTNGYALFPATVCDLIALGVLIFRYRNPLDDKVYQSSKTGQRDASEPLGDDDDIRPELTSRLSHDTRSSQFAAMDSPRRPSTQLVEPPVMDGQA